jgi:ribosomal protein L11 methyltransferase
MPWLVLSLELEAAAAASLSEALLQAGAQSVSLEDAGADWARQRLSALLAPGVDAAALVGQAASAAGIGPAPGFRTACVEDADWVRKSQAQFAPLAIGARLWIVPSWHETPAGPGMTVRLDPGLAFGTGSHPSTRLVLRFLERSLRGGERVLDYGCGSGILAIAAAVLGAGEVQAVDVDQQALETTAENARANRVAVRAFAPEALGSAVFDVVVANILAQPLIVLAPLLAARTRIGGRLVLSGILAGQAEEVAQAYAAWFDLSPSDAEEGWALLEGVRR